MGWFDFTLKVLDRLPEVLAGVVAILGLWMAYNQRHKSYREAVYARQTEISRDLLSAVNALHEKAWEFVVHNSADLSKEARDQMMRTCMGEWEAVGAKLSLSCAFLPEPVLEAVTAYLRSFKDIAFSRTTGGEADQLRDALTGFLVAIRRCLGIGKISDRILAEIGSDSGAKS